MGNKPPLVSIIVPSFNHDKYVEQCIESIYNQSYKDFELIVIDDGSTDGSRDVLNILKKKYDFNLVLQDNIGLSKTLNRGIQEYARGEYITFCASDDYWISDKLGKQVLFMEQNPDIPMCYGKCYYIDTKNNIIKKYNTVYNKNLKGGYIFKDIILLNYHLPANYLFRKSVFLKVGLYKGNLFTEDYYMNLRISNLDKIGYIDDYLSYYRVNPNYQQKPLTRNISNSHLECINEYKDTEYYPEAINKWHFRNYIWYSPYRKHKQFALEEMVRSIRYIYKLSYLKSIFRLLLLWY